MAEIKGRRFEYSDLLETAPRGATLYSATGAGFGLLSLVLAWNVPSSSSAIRLTVLALGLFQAVVLHCVPARISRRYLHSANVTAIGIIVWGLFSLSQLPFAQIGIAVFVSAGAGSLAWFALAAGRLRSLLLLQYSVLMIVVSFWVLVQFVSPAPELAMGLRSLFLGPLLLVSFQFLASVAGWGRSLVALVGVAIGQFGMGVTDLGGALNSAVLSSVGGLCFLAFVLALGIAAWGRRSGDRQR